MPIAMYWWSAVGMYMTTSFDASEAASEATVHVLGTSYGNGFPYPYQNKLPTTLMHPSYFFQTSARRCWAFRHTWALRPTVPRGTYRTDHTRECDQVFFRSFRIDVLLMEVHFRLHSITIFARFFMSAKYAALDRHIRRHLIPNCELFIMKVVEQLLKIVVVGVQTPESGFRKFGQLRKGLAKKCVS